MGLPSYYGDQESTQERSARMYMTAAAVVSAVDAATCSGPWNGADWCQPVWPRAEKRQLAVLLVTLGWHESRFALHVHKNRCRVKLGECDAVRLPDGRYIALARTPWQMQYSPLIREHWGSMSSATAIGTFEAAYAAAKIAGRARMRCSSEGSWTHATISGYASGRSCSWTGAAQRVKTYNRLLSNSWQKTEFGHNTLEGLALNP